VREWQEWKDSQPLFYQTHSTPEVSQFMTGRRCSGGGARRRTRGRWRWPPMVVITRRAAALLLLLLPLPPSSLSLRRHGPASFLLLPACLCVGGCRGVSE
jgi:hypothetical protein